MRAFPLYPQRQTINLHGCWDFAWLEDASTPLADLDLAHLNFNDFQAVPGVFDTDIKRYGKRGVGIYRKRIVFRPRAGSGSGSAALAWPPASSATARKSAPLNWRSPPSPLISRRLLLVRSMTWSSPLTTASSPRLRPSSRLTSTSTAMAASSVH